MAEPTFAVLGPLQVRRGGAPVRTGGPKPRAVLATLLLQPDGFVSLDLLTEVLWPGGAPRSAVANVRTYVRTLRQALAAAGTAAQLRTESSGYVLGVAPADVDMLVFEEHLARARALQNAGDDEGALAKYEAALGLWHGTVLQDMPSSVVWDPAVARLEELRSVAADEYLAVRLRLGDHASLVADVRARLAADPLREDLWRILVHALHRSGRATEARAAYAEAEHVIAAELGTVPSAPLRAVGEEINGYVTLRAAAAPQVPVCQLPMDIPDFTGRAAEIARLEELLSTAGQRPVVAVVSGPPGAGKSTLAVHVAHRVREVFPEGQLFVDLGGMSDTTREPAAVLAELLRGLGVIDSAIPADLGERAALLRSRLAQRRMLIVLDDATGGAQVRPLLPGTGGCAVLVTSRRRLPGLPAHHCGLGVLGHDDARALFGAIVGSGRLRREASDVDRVIDSCGALPLAVRIAGARLANRPGWSVGALAGFLRDERGRLDQLQTGELEVRTSAELSYRCLPEAAARAFRRFGHIPEEAVPGWLVAVGAGQPEQAGRTGPAEPEQAGRTGIPDRPDPTALPGPTGAAAATGPAGSPAADAALETLLDEHLVEVVGTDRLGFQRYRMHGLLRCYARELAERDGQRDRLAQQQGIADALTALARTANAAMPVHFLGVLGPPVPPTGPAATVAEAVRARPVAWFESERRVLVATVESAARLGEAVRAADLAIELAAFFDLRGHYDDWLTTHRLALDALPDPPDARAAALLRNLGQLHLYQDRYAEARTAFDRSQALFAGLGELRGEALAAVGTGSVHRVVGDLQAALDAFGYALHTFTRAGDRHGEAVAQNAIASVLLERREPEEAAGWLDGALELSRSVGDRHREAQVRRRVAVLHELRGEPHRARAELEHALGILDDLADTHCAACVQQSIGELCLRQGEPGAASALLTGALAVQQQLGDRRAQARVACLLGELYDATGRTRAARRYFHRSLATWRRLEALEQAAFVDAKLKALR